MRLRNQRKENGSQCGGTTHLYGKEGNGVNFVNRDSLTSGRVRSHS